MQELIVEKSRYGFRRKKDRMESLELSGPTKSHNTRSVIILITLIVAAITGGIGVATALTIPSATHDSERCAQTAMKMFDEETVPKYLIGPDYKIIQMNPKTTDVMITSCR